MRRELEKIFKDIDVKLSWTSGAQESETSEDLGSQIRIVMVQSEAVDWKLSPEAMGAIMSRNGPQSEIYIFFNSVARTLGLTWRIPPLGATTT